MVNKEIIVGESNYYSVGRNHNKMTILSEMSKGRKVVSIDDGEEYKSICDAFGCKISQSDCKRKTF